MLINREALNFALIAVITVSLTGCAKAEETSNKSASPAPAGESVAEPRTATSNPLKNAYFGDTHIHTELSFDAFLFGTRRTPNDAYLFAKGAGIEHASGFEMKMKKPLDFLAVSDHAFYLGMMREMASLDSTYSGEDMAAAVRGAITPEGSQAGFAAILGHLRSQTGETKDPINDLSVARSAWQEIIEAAERHNDPGNFTTFIAYEYTSSGPAFENLHRNVIFRGSDVPEQPYSRFNSINPEGLWAWMDEQRALGRESLAIPHNSNGSNGWMFPVNNWAGEPIDLAYAQTRMRNEPLVENTQVKGTSDTHPMLSPNDEWSDFEIMPLRIATNVQSKPNGSYVREAYLNGLLIESKIGANPYKFGVIGASDTHNAAGSFEEDNYWSKTGVLDFEPYRRGSVPTPTSTPEAPEYLDPASKYWGASGLAGVWAESNTRDAIYDAMRRKETFSTSGSHIKLRFFAGYEFDQSLLNTEDSIKQAYANGVPMGSDLAAQGERNPSFYVWASRDPDTQPLQRLQIIKGWVEDGKAQEMVVDIACSDGQTVDPLTLRCGDNGARVNVADCTVTANKGDSELSAVWQDPDYDPSQKAFYYVRVLENPTCRWSTYDAIAAGVAPRPDMQSTIQDRAWSSPIWLTQ
tara:strand:- start:862 stop:2766 length:1905 start_codon:yes stop_codon:yes gene_type:complete